MSLPSGRCRCLVWRRSVTGPILLHTPLAVQESLGLPGDSVYQGLDL
jgi:hypothetical protein